MGPLRQQLPVRSPVTLPGLARATLGSFGSDPRPALAELLARRFGADSVLLCDSGTHALEQAIRAAGSGRTGPVLLPAYSCYDVATALLGTDRQAVLYDVDPRTLAPDMDSVHRGLARGAVVVVAGPLYGMVFPMQDLRAGARAAGAVLVEDAAQGHGATVGREASGSLAELSVLSFGRGKGWTGGGGGALLRRDLLDTSGGEPLTALPSARSAPAGLLVGLKTVAQWLLARPSLYRLPASLPWLGLGETHFRPPSSTGEMAPWSAALILAGEQVADTEAELRRERGTAVLEALEEQPVPGITPVMAHGGSQPGYLRIPVLRRGGATGLPPAAHRLGVAAGYPRSLADLPPLRPRILNGDDAFSGARQLARELVTLPSHGAVRPADVSDLLRALAVPGST